MLPQLDGQAPQRRKGFPVCDEMVEVVSEECWARNYMGELGFSLGSITRALEKTDFDFAMPVFYRSRSN